MLHNGISSMDKIHTLRRITTGARDQLYHLLLRNYYCRGCYYSQQWQHRLYSFNVFIYFSIPSYLHTSLPLEKREDLMTSGAIHEYVPAALILVVLCHSLAKPKSVIFNVFLPMSLFSILSSNKTVGEKEKKAADTQMINTTYQVS